MITAFAGPKAAEGFLNNVNWRWGFGAFAIIVPAMTMPLFILLKLKLRKAEQEGRYVKESNGRTFLQSIWYGLVSFDRKSSSPRLPNGTASGTFAFTDTR